MSKDENVVVKLRFTGSQYTLSYSKNNGEFQTDITIDSTQPIFNSDALIYLGCQGSAGNPFTGSIDLNECYININDLEWWKGTDSIKYRLSSDGHKVCDYVQENAIQSVYELNGVAWYYIIDTVNSKFKLPRSKWNFVGLRNAVGDYVAETLPNITGGLENTVMDSGSNTGGEWYVGNFEQTGALRTESYVSNEAIAGASYSNGENLKSITLDASLSSSTYQDNAPVQQRATEMYLYFYVGDVVRNTSIINVTQFGDRISEIESTVKQQINTLGSSIETKLDMNRITNCITEIPQDVEFDTSVSVDVKNMYAWVNYILGVIFFSENEILTNGDKIYHINSETKIMEPVRTVGEDAIIVDETTFTDTINLNYNFFRESEHDTVDIIPGNKELTLLPYSKVYFPDGLSETNSYAHIVRTLENGVKVDTSLYGDGKYYIIFKDTDLILEDLSFISVGHSLPTESLAENQKFFDLDSHFIYNYNGTEWEKVNYSLPLGIAVIENGLIKDFDKVFNGFGFFGNMAFALPGITIMIPNGRKKKDGTYASLPYTQKSVLYALREWQPSVNEYLFFGKNYLGFQEYYYEQSNEPERKPYVEWYDTERNVMYFYHNTYNDWVQYDEICIADNVSKESNIVTDWNMKKVFKIDDSNDLKDKIEDNLETKLETKANIDLSNILANIDYVVETKVPTTEDPTWYRVYKSGWVEQGGLSETIPGNGGLDIIFPKQMVNNLYNVSLANADYSIPQIPGVNRMTTKMNVDYQSASYEGKVIWEVKGQGA